jgi:hypothetical protein
MSARSAYHYLVSKIGENRSSASNSEGTSYRPRRISQGARPASSDSYDSTMSHKHASLPPQASNTSICSSIRGTRATGLSKTPTPRTRDQSLTNTKPVNTHERRHRLLCLPNVFTRRREKDSQTSTKRESIETPHSNSTPPEYSQAPPLLVVKDQSESLGATPPPSIIWHTRPSDVNGTPKAELILYPAESLWRRRTYATLDGARGSDQYTWADGRSISHLVGLVHEEVKNTATGPFWDRKYRKLNDAMTNVISRNGSSVNEVIGIARIGVREDTVDLSPLFVLRKKWKDFREELMGSPAALSK